MLTLENNHLKVEILDPKTDSERFGPRYCTGGYIFQIEDKKLGPLLSGPTYPDSFNWFDGQGIPDAFNLSPLKSKESDSVALILGIGLCDLEGKSILHPCSWQISEETNALTFTTEHVFDGWTVQVQRKVSLIERSVLSWTQVENRGRLPVPMRWFPHPFFPHLPQGQDELIKLSTPTTFPTNNAYEVAANGFIRRQNWPWSDGHYQALDHRASSNLVLIQRHPLLGQMTATCSYVPDFFPIWGNPQTFSWEPFLERTVAPGQSHDWQIDYDF